jgi:hypothetical protein
MLYVILLQLKCAHQVASSSIGKIYLSLNAWEAVNFRLFIEESKQAIASQSCKELSAHELFSLPDFIM